MTSEEAIRIARVIPQTIAEGPGRRFAVWVQGCAIRCDGCFNPHLWRATGGTSVEAVDLAQQATRANVEGVTLLGGEPFEQANGLAAFASAVQQAGLSVMTFTGYTLSDLHSQAAANPGISRLIGATDLLVDGPYLADHSDLSRPWVGSTNQQFHFLTDRYRHLEPRLDDLPDRLEIRITADGQLSVNGWATVDQLDGLLEASAPSPRRGKIR